MEHMIDVCMAKGLHSDIIGSYYLYYLNDRLAIHF